MSETNNGSKRLPVLGASEVSSVYAIPLECIQSYNVRSVLPRLAAAGVTYEQLIKMSLGSDENKAEMARLVEEHEAETYRLDPKEHTLIQLASDLVANGQLQPIIVRQTGQSKRRDTGGNVIEGEMRYGYQVVLGGRRTLATAYAFAKGWIAKPEVLARQRKMTKEEAFDLSIAENLQRKDFTERELGEIVATMVDGGVTWATICQRMRRSEPTLRSALVLVRPENADAPLDLPEQVDAGLITKGEAVAIAKGRKPKLGDGGDRLFRSVRKTIGVKDIEKLIDATARNEHGFVRIMALAEVIGSTFEAELEASDARLVANATKEAAKAEQDALKAEIEALKARSKELQGRKKKEVVTSEEMPDGATVPSTSDSEEEAA